MMRYVTQKRLLIAGVVLLVLITLFLFLKPDGNGAYCDNPDEFGYCLEDQE